VPRSTTCARLGEVIQELSNGLIFLDVLDCRGVDVGSHVPRVSVSIERIGASTGSPAPTFFYKYPLVPDQAGHTDSNGLVLVAIVKPDLYTVTATLDERRLGAVQVRVEADAVTSFHFVPTPPSD